MPLALPTPGLLRPRFASNAPVAAALLGIAAVDAASAEPECCWLDAALPEGAPAREVGLPPCEARVRGRELIAGFDATEDGPHFDAVWRLMTEESVPGALVMLDLIVSVHARQLDVHPGVYVLSRFAVPEVFWWDAGEARRASRAAGMAVTPIARPGERRFGALIVRPSGIALSYVEMVHPADDLGTEWIDPTAPVGVEAGSSFVSREMGAAATPAAACARRRLFASSLEKGVLLRARVRGALVERDADADAAARLYEAFASADPPLGA